MATTLTPPPETGIDEPAGTAADEGPSYRTLPHNVEAERGLLGAILVDNRAYERVSEFLQPEHFALPQHARIFEAIGKLIERGQIADPITLKRFFEHDEALSDVGGPAYLAELAATAVTIINAGEYGRVIYDLHLKRELIVIGQDIVENAFGGVSTNQAPTRSRLLSKASMTWLPRGIMKVVSRASRTPLSPPSTWRKQPTSATVRWPALPQGWRMWTACWVACTPRIC